MELMIVVVSLGLIAGFAIPSYQKAVDRSYERDGINSLILLSGVQEVYRARNGDYWPAFTGDCGGGNCGIADGLNTALGVNIIENNVSYFCAAQAGPGSYACYASRAGYLLYIDQSMPPNPPNVPCCEFGTCPTAPDCP